MASSVRNISSRYAGESIIVRYSDYKTAWRTAAKKAGLADRRIYDLQHNICESRKYVPRNWVDGRPSARA